MEIELKQVPIKDTLDDPIVSDHTEAAFIHQIFDNESEIEK